MASRLFKLKKEDDSNVEYKSYFDRSNFFHPTKFGNIRNYLIDCLPKKLICCKLSRKELGIRNAIHKMNQEIDIIEMIKTRRYLKLCLRELLPQKVRMDLKQRSRYLLIDPDQGPKGPDDEVQEMLFDSVLDKYEYELNQEDVFLTDGFYSSEEDDKKETWLEKHSDLPKEFQSSSES